MTCEEATVASTEDTEALRVDDVRELSESLPRECTTILGIVLSDIANESVQAVFTIAN